MVGLPDFVTYDDANRRFTVTQSSDLSLIGVYSIILRSEISVPDDNTLATSTLITVEEEITININPCHVDDYSLTNAVQEINY